MIGAAFCLKKSHNRTFFEGVEKEKKELLLKKEGKYMGYKGHITEPLVIGCCLDMISDIQNTIGKKIRIGTTANYPTNEIDYTLIDANVQSNGHGVIINFSLKDGQGTYSSISIKNIKSFEYDINLNHKKYWVCFSDDPLTTEVQHGKDNYRFFLFD
ncbi:hypothetical protein [Paenibacillus sp. RC84]|uniref:hypothetical protein n=1 Tax=Paenibacillus sp. RC84 TaxID=3156252 RepID=UPI0035198EFD